MVGSCAAGRWFGGGVARSFGGRAFCGAGCGCDCDCGRTFRVLGAGLGWGNDDNDNVLCVVLLGLIREHGRVNGIGGDGD